ncbi:MAG TPA: TGS domain-containing protein, partial [Ktedonobacterales bacterium]|nr:TGS domain-containing protein [Ktedonobacterales bacterium]
DAQSDDEGAIATPAVANPLQEMIFVFTPAGDVKELPAGATPIDFAYRVHTTLGDHVAGVRITQDDGSGRPVKRLVPLDHELRSGDVVEVIKRNDAHPTRDWLRIVKTRLARNRILHYLKTYERDVDIQVGRERLDRELRAIGLRHGFEGVSEDDLTWLAREFKQPDEQGLLAAIGGARLKVSAVIAKARERLLPPPLVGPADETSEAGTAAYEPEPEQPVMTVQGMEGLLTQLATCCNPLPGDPLIGFTTRGRGVVIHRADCPNVKNMLARSPERGIAVAWPEHVEIQQTLRAPIVVEAHDRTGLLRDVTAAISGLKINMQRVSVNVNPRTRQATIHATLDIQRAEQLEQALSEVRKVQNVFSAERKEPNIKGGASATKPAKADAPGKGRK